MGHTVSSHSIVKVADFCCFYARRNISVSSVKGFRSMLSSAFKFCLPEIQNSFLLHDLIRSFELERPAHSPSPPAWDLVKVLTFLRGPVFEPLASRELRTVTTKVLFLLSLVTGKCVSELQALSRQVAFQGNDMSLSYLPEFVAKTESERNPFPHFFLVRSLEDFVGDLPEDRLLCLVQAIRMHLDLTASVSPHPRALFVSPSCPTRALSKNALSFFLRKVIIDSASLVEGASPRAYNVRGVATSALILHNWSGSKVLEAATWRSNPVFASFYLRDISYALEGCRSLGPFVAAGSVLQ